MYTRTITRVVLAGSILAPGALVVTQRAAAHVEEPDERYLYVSAIAQSAADPDFIAVIGADPAETDFGEIVDRVDMPNVGDELHHFGYSADQQRLIVPGLFSNRVHVFDIGADGAELTLSATNEDLVADSGYAVPHGVMTMHGRVLAPMIGAANEQTQPGGIVELDGETGAFVGYFGPGPERRAGESGPTWMYDFAMSPDGEVGISSTFGAPAGCAAGIVPTCLGDEVAVWDMHAEAVVQTESLGEHSGALMIRFLPGADDRRAFINTPGTNAVWLAADDDGDGTFEFEQVLGADDGIELPMDLVVSYDGTSLYVTNWFADTVQRFDVTDPYHPRLQATVDVPHPNMLRVSRDDSRVYVSNSLLTPWDNDASFGEARNGDYGIWLFEAGSDGSLTSSTADGGAWVDFTNVAKHTSTGPAGPHMMLFDPSVPLGEGEH